jgi:ribosomal RNA-processing protein 1
MEMSLAKRLAHTLKAERDSAFSLVTEWACGPAAARGGRGEMLKMWKALFYCVWMSDGPLVQGELSLRLAGMMRRMQDHVALDFLGAFFETLRREWAGLDRYRVDKFMGLTRRFVFEAFSLLASKGWRNEAFTDGVIKELERALLEPPSGLQSHVADVYVDELAASGAADTNQHMLLLLSPLFALLARCEERAVVARAVKSAFEEALLPAIEAAWTTTPAASSAPQVESSSEKPFRMRGLPAEARKEKHAAELKTLLDDRAARDAARADSFRGLSVAAVARAIFQVGSDAATHAPNRDFAYRTHKLFAALALRVGEVKREEDTYPKRGEPQAPAAVRASAVGKAPGVDALAKISDIEGALALRKPKPTSRGAEKEGEAPVKGNNVASKKRKAKQADVEPDTRRKK